MTRLNLAAAVIAALAVTVTAQNASAHKVHPSCANGPVSPTGVGPSHYHKTPEAGVHIRCVQRQKGKLKIKPRSEKRSANQLRSQ